MDLRTYLELFRKWLWLFVLATTVAAAGSLISTAFIPRTYSSETTLMVGRPTADPSPNDLGIYVSESLAQIYGQMATRQPVLAGVVQALKLGTDWRTLRGMVKASPNPGSNLLEIRVIDTDPQRVQVLANEIANQLIVQSPTPTEREKLENKAFVDGQMRTLRESITRVDQEVKDLNARLAVETSARAIADLQSHRNAKESQIETWRTQYADLSTTFSGSAVNSLSVIEPAAAGEPVGPHLMANVLLAAALGFGLALVAAMVLEYLDDTIKTGEQVELKLGLIELATVGHVSGVVERRDGLVTFLQPRSGVAEAYRVLRTNLQFSLLEHPQATLVVTSANPGEGKSTTAANLAVVLAQGGRRVILVDTDLRRPALHRFFGLANSDGLTTHLLDELAPIAEALHAIESVPGLSVLTSGPLPPNPSEVLESQRLVRLLHELRQRADLVVLDSPPLLAVADAAILAKRVDGTLLVFHSGTTRTAAARRSVDILRKVGVTPLGAVVNNLLPSRIRGYYGSERYAYDYNVYYGSPTEGEGTSGNPPPGSAATGPARGGHGAHGGHSGPLGWLRQAVAAWLG